MHDQIQQRRIKTVEGKRNLRRWFTELREWLSERAEESTAESQDLMDEITLDDGDGDTIKDRVAKAHWVTNMDEGEHGAVDPADPKDDPTPKPRPEQPKLQRKFLPERERAQGRLMPNSNYRIRLRPTSKIADCVLKVVVDNGMDLSCFGTIKNKSLAIASARNSDGEEYRVDGGMVRLGDVRENEMLTVDVAFKNIPNNFRQIALDCLIGSMEEKE